MSDHPTALGGTCSARFDPLRELFAAKLESGEDLGASLAFNIDGEMVVDLWGSWADIARTVPWTENTITNVFTTTKALNYGHLIGEVIRRITGQRLGEFFAAHIAGPVGADFLSTWIAA
jgi:CubicO group peptidase (beta-lactamase class C family)